MEAKKKKINKFVTIEYDSEKVIISNTKGGLDEIHLKLDTLTKIKNALDSSLKGTKKTKSKN